MTGFADGAVEDGTLIERARAGEAEAFDELVVRHAGRLHGALRGFGLDESDAQEVAQETFLRAWRGLARFERRAQFFTWLYRIGFNEAQRRLAKRPPAGAVVSTSERPVDDLPDAAVGPAGLAEQDELRNTLARALRRLPPKLRAPVVLRDVEGLSTEQAAAVLELGEAAFKSRLHRGRMALHALIGQ